MLGFLVCLFGFFVRTQKIKNLKVQVPSASGANVLQLFSEGSLADSWGKCFAIDLFSEGSLADSWR